MHEPVEDRGADRVVAEIGAPVLHDPVGGDDHAAVQLVALMDERLQQTGNCSRAALTIRADTRVILRPYSGAIFNPANCRTSAIT